MENSFWKSLELIKTFLFVLAFLCALYGIFNIQQPIITRYTLLGAADGYGYVYSIMVYPVLMLALDIFTRFLNMNPGMSSLLKEMAGVLSLEAVILLFTTEICILLDTAMLPVSPLLSAAVLIITALFYAFRIRRSAEETEVQNETVIE